MGPVGLLTYSLAGEISFSGEGNWEVETPTFWLFVVSLSTC
jgi:hypothetical protein